MRIMTILSAAALVSLSSSGSRADTPTTGAAASPDWKRTAREDILFAARETAENHPGMVDPANRAFSGLLDKATKRSLALADKVTTAAGYDASLTAFYGAFNDGHAGAFAQLPEALAAPVSWTGFTVAWRGSGLRVFQSGSGGPPVGARLVSCDGRSANDLIRRNVFAVEGRAAELGRWWVSAPSVFVDRGNPFVTRPKDCLFDDGDRRLAVTLKWRPIDGNYQRWAIASTNGDTLPVGMRERAPGLWWIAMPTFQPGEADRTAYAGIVADIAARRAELLGARAIVLDLRHNQGGSSEWSRSIAAALWGKSRVDAGLEALFAEVEIWWRASTGNERYVRSIISSVSDEDRKGLEAVADGMAAAIARGAPFHIERSVKDPAPAGGPDPAATLPLTIPVYVIVPGQCASACLDAIDAFKLFNNTILIGAPSSSDSTYLEVRTATLPSGYGSVIIPMKIWVHRPRGNGAFYRPDVTMTDLDWTTASFQRRIEQHLIESGQSAASGKVPER